MPQTLSICAEYPTTSSFGWISRIFYARRVGIPHVHSSQTNSTTSDRRQKGTNFRLHPGQAFQSCRSSLKECHPEQRRSFARRMIVTAEGSAVERQGLLRLHHGQQVTEPLHGNYEQYLSPCAREPLIKLSAFHNRSS